MKRILVGCAALMLVVVMPAFADEHDPYRNDNRRSHDNRMVNTQDTRTGFDVRNAPTAPTFDWGSDRPRWRRIHRQNVYVLNDNTRFDNDVFRYGSWYYTYSNGYWYRARSYRGPFRVVRADLVPRNIFSVSMTDYSWKHHPDWMPRTRRARRY